MKYVEFSRTISVQNSAKMIATERPENNIIQIVFTYFTYFIYFVELGLVAGFCIELERIK